MLRYFESRVISIIINFYFSPRTFIIWLTGIGVKHLTNHVFIGTIAICHYAFRLFVFFPAYILPYYLLRPVVGCSYLIPFASGAIIL